MKDLKRALRRHQWNVKFKKRIKNWFCSRWPNDHEEREIAIKGEGYLFLRTTGNPCNCYDCSVSNKYVREQKQYIEKDIND